ncbi:hypothetical protein J5751_00695 [bacterium]|nr:hypothetical protein [bacterium]
MNRNLVLEELSAEMNKLQNSIMKLAEKIVLLAETTYDTPSQKEIKK